jgi:hypothetical protein
MWAKPPAGAKPNMAHSHARGLRHCFLFNERSGRLVTDCVGGLQATFTGTPTWTGRLHGGSIHFDGSSELTLTAGKAVFGRPSGSDGPFTVIAGVMQTGSQSGFQTIWANGNEGLYINNGHPLFYNTGPFSTVMAVDKPYVISASSNGPNPTNIAAGEMECTINGMFDFENNYQSLPVMSGATIGGHGSERFTGEISFLYVYDRSIPNGSSTAGRFDGNQPSSVGTGGAMQLIHMDPFAMFYARARSAIYSAATHTAGGGTGSPGGPFNALLVAP